MSTQHEIDQLFADQLHDYEVVPPQKVWDQIEATLDQSQKKRAFIFLHQWMWAASILLIIAMATGIYLLLPNLGIQRVEVADNKPNKTEPNHLTEQKLLPSISANSVFAMTPTRNSSKNKSIDRETSNLMANNKIISKDETTSNAKQQVIVSQQNTNNTLQPLKSQSAYIDATYNIDTKSIKREKKYLPLPNPNLLTFEALNASTQKDDNKKWQVGALIAPTYAYRTVNKSSQPNESGLNTLNGGVTVKMNRSKRLVIETGIIYAKAGQQVVNQSGSLMKQPIQISNSYAAKAQVNSLILTNSLGKVSVHSTTPTDLAETNLTLTSVSSEKNYAESPAEFELKQVLEYIEVPVTARYFLTSYKHTNISLSTGLSANFLIGNNALLIQDGHTSRIGKTQNIDPVSYSTKLGLGVDVPLSTSFTINVEPVFKYFITPVNHSAGNNFRPYTMGLNTGITYRF